MDVKIRFVAVRPTRAAAATALVLLIAALAASFILITPPGPLGQDADPALFAEGRARVHVDRLSAAPRPIGSAGHAASIAYIKEYLSSLGVAVEDQVAPVVDTSHGAEVRAATVQNVLAKIPGANPSKALLLMAHFDSVPNSPGAGDDGSGVATLLETARALTAGPRLANDVVFLFTDGEEEDLFGVRAFFDRHPWAKDVGLVLNFEGRGSSGPVLLFESSSDNGWLIRETASATGGLYSTSLMDEVYERLPNDTDLSYAFGHGYPGLNFAFMGDPTTYHSARDTSEHLSGRTLQHMGELALAAARHFGESNLADVVDADATFFNPAGYWFIHVPEAWVMPAAGIAAVLFLVLLAAGFMTGKVNGGGFVLGIVLFAALCATVTWPLVFYADEAVAYYGSHAGFHAVPYLAALTLCVLGLFTLIYGIAGRYVVVTNFIAGVLFWFTALGVTAAFLYPGAAYVFLWPLAFGLAAFVVYLILRDPNFLTAWSGALVAILLAPALALLAVTDYHLLQALEIEGVGVAIGSVALTLGLLLPLLHVVYRRYLWRFPIAMLVIGLGLLAILHARWHFGDPAPREDHVAYWLDGGRGEAVWASHDAAPDAFTSQFVPEGAGIGDARDVYPTTDRRFRVAPAEAVDLAKPEVEVIRQEVDNATRRVHLVVRSPRNAPILSVYPPPESSVTGVSVQGVELPPPGARSIHYWSVPAEGVEIVLEGDANEPIDLLVVDQSYGLPDTGYEPRPPHLLPDARANLYFSDATVVKTIATIETTDAILRQL